MPKNTLRATGGLNSDVEKYLLPKGDYIDAKNIVLDTSVSGGAGAVKTMEAITQVKSFATGLINPLVKASVVDNLGVLYVLVKGDTYAKIFKYADGDTSFTEVVKYTHLVATDFVPDLRKVGDTLVWNYREGGVPLSWYVNRASATITDITDITLIKKPPVFNFSFTATEAGQQPTDISLSASNFSEALASGGTVATLTALDTPGETSLTFTIDSVKDVNNNDVTSKFSIVDGNTSDNQALLVTNTTFSYARTEDRSFTFIFRVTDSGGLSYAEENVITLTGGTPAIALTGYTITLDDNVAVGTDTLIDVSGTSGTADPANTEGLVFTTDDSQFEFDINNNLVTATALTAGVYNITATVFNAYGNFVDDPTPIVATISASNSAPVTNDVAYNGDNSLVSRNSTSPEHTFYFDATDNEGDPLTYFSTLNTGGSIVVDQVNESVIYTPPADMSVTNLITGDLTYYAQDTEPLTSNTSNVTANILTRPIGVRDFTSTTGGSDYGITLNKIYIDSSDSSNPAGANLTKLSGFLNNKLFYWYKVPANTQTNGSDYLYLVFTVTKYSSTPITLKLSVGAVGAKLTNVTYVTAGVNNYSSFIASREFKIKVKLSEALVYIWNIDGGDSYINVTPSYS